MSDMNASLLPEQELLRLQSAALNAAANAIIITDSDGVICWVNPAFTCLTGYSSEEVIGQTPRLLKSGKHGAEFYHRLWQTISGGEVWHGEMTNRRKDGRLYTEEQTITPVPDESGTISHYIAVKQDITARLNQLEERREAEEAARQQAAQIQQIVDSLPEGVLLLDAAQRIMLVNPVAQTYLDRLNPNVRVGQVLTELGGHLLEPYLVPVTDDGLWPALYPHGSDDIYEIGARQLHEGPQSGGWVIVLLDITEDREEYERLQVQQRLASIGQLAAGIAHDFNNVLAVISLYSQALERNPDVTARQRYLRTINEQAGHASNLIAQILDFSRTSVIDRKRLNLSQFVKDVVALLRRTLSESITISLALEATSYWVEADPTRLQQVLMNLAVNARDAMPEGGELRLHLRQLTVGSHEDTPLPDLVAGDWLCLTVTDTGSGIDEETLSHIFDPFFTTKPLGQGSGLGLAQVYGIIKQHGGEIDVVSGVGEGTTFAVYLPLVATAGESESEADGESVIEGQVRQTVLLVEDNEILRTAMEDILDSFGLQVLSAANGREALAIFRQQPGKIELVLSDIAMPEMGGLQLYEALKEVDPAVKLVFVTGYPLGADTKRLLAKGEVRWLAKPFSEKELFALVYDNLRDQG